MTLLIASCIGTAMGLIAGLFGVGGGIIAVPCLIYFMDMDPKHAIGTSLAVIVPVAIAGSIKHFQQGYVNIPVALSVAVAGIIFSVIGAWLSHRLSNDTLQRLFAILVLAIGIKMLLQPRKIPAPAQTQTIEQAQPIVSVSDESL